MGDGIAWTQRRGVRQGGVLSPNLYILAFNYVLNHSVLLSHLISEGRLKCYADDVLVVAKDAKEVEKVISEIELLEKFGLEMNRQKTDIVAMRNGQTVPKEINGVKVQKSIKYLGISIDSQKKDMLKQIN